MGFVEDKKSAIRTLDKIWGIANDIDRHNDDIETEEDLAKIQQLCEDEIRKQKHKLKKVV